MIGPGEGEGRCIVTSIVPWDETENRDCGGGGAGGAGDAAEGEGLKGLMMKGGRECVCVCV